MSLFAQGGFLLLDAPIGLDAIAAAIGGRGGRLPERGPWMFEQGALAGEGFSIDAIDRAYPDDLGDPREAPDLFTAWTLGFFGPFAYPGGLARALAHGPGLISDEQVGRHRALLRVLVGPRPGPRDRVRELLEMTETAAALAGLPGAISWFDPGGEALRPLAALAPALARHRAGGPPPLPLWCTPRHVDLRDVPGWSMVDLVGLAQLGLPDAELCFPSGSVDLDRAAAGLFDLGLYLLGGARVADGDVVTLPGGDRWRCRAFQHSVLSPPRPVLRWSPERLALPAPLAAEPEDLPPDTLTPHFRFVRSLRGS